MSSKFQSRITGEGNESPEQILANPYNFRRHPKEQLDALEGALDEIGWIQRVIVNERTGHLIDGHARVELAIRRGEKEVPVVYVDLSEHEERIALATLDPITGLAFHDEEQLAALLEGLEVSNDALADFLDSMKPADSDAGKADAAETRASLVEQFLIPPFTVLDARQGYWQDRKRMWLSLGIRSELGRGQDGEKAAAGGLTFSVSAQPGHVHDRKREIEARDGQEYTWAEFATKYPEEITMAGDSIFDPVLCEIAYRWFCPPGGSVLDPFAGGSVRGAVAGVLGYQYTGIDLRREQVEANRSNWNEITGRQEPPEPIRMSAAWAAKPFDCTLGHITAKGGCGGACCRHKTTWPAKAYPGNVCEHLGDAGCSLSPQDKPVACQLYPFIQNSAGTLVMHDKAQLKTSFCKGAAGKGPMLIDAMAAGLTNLFGEAQFKQAREDVLAGRDPVFYASKAVADDLRQETAWEEANQPVIPRTQRERATTAVTLPETGVEHVN